MIPYPPAPVLWAMAALDIVATIVVWRRLDLLWVLGICILASLYLTVVGLFSIGPLYFVLLIVQIVRLVVVLKRLIHPQV